ncbi:YceD family protein [Arcticibacterium luteifluviistationis]|uniref:DUF177 domain-containing protein n=1 Tax=Arcticibacterium luteifluviistationis TaxID=1784714 RepID=A0A2Z4GDH9_9BACT|nr:DUF177 domain-containing protein [Arcticibacterium luteifluviistationis]AWV99214.1 DUF177 domain-containing protein [Arcticibacterium luteifluviistationis]
MKEHSKYQINIQGLENKRHEFDFEGDDAFFESFEQELIEKGNFKANIKLDKSSTMIRLDVHILGSVTLVCDRSLEEFEEPIEIHEKYVYKFGDDYEIVSEDMEVIPFEAMGINLARNLFEYIGLAVPMKRIHPDLRDEDDEGGFVFSDTIEEKLKPKKEEFVDPRWAALQILKKDL